MMRREVLKAGAAAAALAAAGACAKQRAETPSRPEDLADLDATALAAAIRDGHVSAAEAAEAALARIAALDPKINAFTHVDPEGALARADRVDRAAPFAGVPFGVKDLSDYPGMPFRSGAAFLRDNVGKGKSPYTEKLESLGLVVLGKTATPEFGLLPTTEPTAYAATVNPYKEGYSSGGSSGGSAAAVAARLLPVAYAGDGGGSIRIPAAACGLFGLKCTRGRFAGQGEPALAVSLSIHHPLTRSVRDSAALLALSEASDGDLPEVGFVAPARLSRLKIAMSLENGAGRRADAEIAAAVEKAARRLEEMGCEIVPVEASPLKSHGFGDAFTLVWASGAFGVYQLAARLGGRPPEDSRLIEPFTIALAELFRSTSEGDFAAAVARIREVEGEVDRWFATYDAWLTPVVGGATPRLGWLKGDVPMDGLIPRLTDHVGFTPIHNAAGTPAAAIPFGRDANGLPIGVQIAAGKGKEALLLRFAYALEESDPWADKKPDLAS
jgi:amidase